MSFSFSTDPCRGHCDFTESLLQASSPFIHPLLTPTHAFQRSAFALRHRFPQSYHSPPLPSEIGGKKTASQSRLIDSGHNEKPHDSRGCQVSACLSAPWSLGKVSVPLNQTSGRPSPLSAGRLLLRSPVGFKVHSHLLPRKFPRVAKWRPLCSRKAVARPDSCL